VSEGEDQYGYDYEEAGYYPPQPPRRPVGGKQAFILALALALIALVAFGGISLPSTPDSPGNAPPVAAAPVVPSAECKPEADTRRTIWAFLRGSGLSKPVTAGVMGNIQAESGFKPDVVERGSGIGYGLVQWSYDRRTNLFNAARDQKVSVNDICFQLKYLVWELQQRRTDEPEYQRWPNEWEMLKNMPNEVEALVAFHHETERSKIMNLPTAAQRRQAVIDQRLKFVIPFMKDSSFQ
jgi:hypothetical protein